jgi:hypothetical protein
MNLVDGTPISYSSLLLFKKLITGSCCGVEYKVRNIKNE